MPRKRIHEDYPKVANGLAFHPDIWRELDRQARANNLSRSQQAENYLALQLRLDLQNRHRKMAA